MSSIRLNSLSDFSRHGYKLPIDCRSCKRVAIIDPLELSLLCQRKGWSRQMQDLKGKLRCSECGAKNARLGPGLGLQTNP